MLQWHQRKGTTICDFSVFGKLHISRSQQNDRSPFSKASTLEGVSEKLQFREGTFFLGGGEGWGILGFFSQKSVGPPLRFNGNTPDPPPFR